MALNLFTTNYGRFHPGMGVPVRTSLGFPRWRLPYPLTHHVSEITPRRHYLQAPRPQFEDAYRSQLNTFGVDHLAGVLTGIAAQAGDDRLVLMCFEKLETGAWCHRRIFAEWWEERTGDKVRELGPTGPPVDPYEQGSLL